MTNQQYKDHNFYIDTYKVTDSQYNTIKELRKTYPDANILYLKEAIEKQFNHIFGNNKPQPKKGEVWITKQQNLAYIISCPHTNTLLAMIYDDIDNTFYAHSIGNKLHKKIRNTSFQVNTTHHT